MSDNQSITSSQSMNDTERLRMEPGVDFINTLNDDCLAEIFKYLSIVDRLRVQAVCKRWREKTELVWRDMRTIDFNSWEIPRRLNEVQAIGIILEKSGNYLRHLILGHCPRSAIVPLIAAHCPDLKYLQITLEGSDSIESWALLTELEHLTLAGSPSNFSQNFFDTLACRNLMNLTLFSTRIINSNSLNPAQLSPTMFEKLPKLSVLFVDSFHLTEDVLIAMFRNSNLIQLTLISCFIEGEFPSLNVINLERLDILATNMITDGFLSQVSKICKNLRYLRLACTDELTDAGLIKLGRLPQLEELDIHGNYNITDEPFSRFHTLKRLTCSSCHKVRDNGIITLMKYAPSLQFLHLRHSGVTKRMLIEASKIVKERSNDLELKIIVSDILKSQWKPKDVSPLLVVETVNY